MPHALAATNLFCSDLVCDGQHSREEQRCRAAVARGVMLKKCLHCGGCGRGVAARELGVCQAVQHVGILGECALRTLAKLRRRAWCVALAEQRLSQTNAIADGGGLIKPALRFAQLAVRVDELCQGVCGTACRTIEAQFR